MGFLDAMTTAVLPVVAIAAAGYGYATVREVDVEPLADVTLNLLVPALVFHTLATTALGGAAALRVAVGVVAVICAMVALAYAAGRLFAVDRRLMSPLVLASAFPNSGNLGIPLSTFAFGATGRTVAVLFVTVQGLVVYTLGVAVAARGRFSAREAVTEVFRLPLVYAATAALAARWLGVVPPASGAAMTTLELVGNASIPLLLLILGAQLADIEFGAVTGVALPSALKLGLAPVVGAAIVLALGVRDATVAAVFVLECATPSAILPLLLTLTYEPDAPAGAATASEYLSTTILVTTLASLLTLAGMIVLLQSGVLP